MMTPCVANRRWIVLCVCWLALCCAGCARGPGDTPDLGTVSGTVTLDGKPLAGATVEFSPESGRPSSGETDAGGKYVLQYSANNPGAKVGKHVVRIKTEKYVEKANGETVMTEETLPPKYHAETELTEEVKAGPNEINFDLQSQ